MSNEATQEQSRNVITLAGRRVHADNLEGARQRLFSVLDGDCVKPLNIVVDLANVEFVDSSFLAMLVSFHNELKTAGGSVKLCGLQRPVRRIFEMMRLHRVFDVHEDAPSALEAFA